MTNSDFYEVSSWKCRHATKTCESDHEKRHVILGYNRGRQRGFVPNAVDFCSISSVLSIVYKYFKLFVLGSIMNESRERDTVSNYLNALSSSKENQDSQQ